MPTLASVQGGSLVPNIAQALRQDIGAFQQRGRDKEAQGNLSEQLQIALGGQPQGAEQAPVSDSLGILGQLNPQVAQMAGQLNQSKDPKQVEEFRAESERGMALARELQAMPDHASKLRRLREEAGRLTAQGGDVNRIVELANKTEGQLELELEKMQVVGNAALDAVPEIRTGGPTAFLSDPVRREAFSQIAASNPKLAQMLLNARERELGRTAKAGEAVTGDFSKSPGVITERDGQNFIQIPVLNKETGRVEMQEVPVSGDLVSKLGETGGQQTERAITEAGGKTRATKEETRIQGQINAGIEASDALPNLNRALELIDTVETGGFANAALQARQFFGVEGADEGELSAALGKAVLKQLRATFGAAFTEGEGNRLASIEAGFGRSRSANRRLIQNAKDIVSRVVRRGRRSAEKSGDTFSIEELDRSEQFRLGAENNAAPAAQGAPTATGPNGERLILQNGQWVQQ